MAQNLKYKMLPAAFVSKMKPYQIEFHDATVKVDVFDPFWTSESALEEKLSELKNQLNPERRVAGIGFKQDSSTSSYCWLLLCIGNHCLIIKLVVHTEPAFYFSSGNRSPLETILSDHTICFVGVNITDTSHMLSNKPITYDRYKFPMPKINAWEIDNLVARIRQKPALFSCRLMQKLAIEVGMEINPNTTQRSIDWNAKVFSEEDIKFAVYDVYYSSRIADKLMYG